MTDRPAIVQIQELVEADVARVVISLSWRDASVSGEAEGPAGQEHRPRLVGEATLRAVEAVTDGAVGLSLAAVAATDLGAAQIAMAQVSVDGTGETLVGTALITGDDRSAATVRAVMDALNRRLLHL